MRITCAWSMCAELGGGRENGDSGGASVLLWRDSGGWWAGGDEGDTGVPPADGAPGAHATGDVGDPTSLLIWRSRGSNEGFSVNWRCNFRWRLASASGGAVTVERVRDRGALLRNCRAPASLSGRGRLSDFPFSCSCFPGLESRLQLRPWRPAACSWRCACSDSLSVTDL